MLVEEWQKHRRKQRHKKCLALYFKTTYPLIGYHGGLTFHKKLRIPRRSIFHSVPIQIQNYSASGSAPLFNDALAVRFSNRYRSKFKITQPRAAHLFSTTPSPFDFPIGTDPNSKLLSLGQHTSFQRRPRRSIFQSVPIQIQNYSASGSAPLFNDALAVRFSNRYRSKFKITQPRAPESIPTQL